MFGNSTPLIFTVLLGGLIVSALGTAQTVYLQKEPIQMKAAFRDFCIGAIMVTFLYQIIPDSVMSFGSMLSAIELPKMPSVKSMTDSKFVGSETDFDIQVGVPKF
jgi:hypothetical protein